MQDEVTFDSTQVASCGECSLCCDVLGIAVQKGEVKLSDHTTDGSSPPGERCQFCSKDEGCSIYEHEKRPQACSDFECWWLQSQRSNQKMEEQDRPDKLGAVIWSDPKTGTITVNIPASMDGAWREGRIRKLILRLDHAGLIVFVCCGERELAVSKAAIELVKKGATIKDNDPRR